MKKSDFKHGASVTCTIEGDYIDDAKICIEDGDVYVCQNEKDGSDCENKLGYKYSWIIFSTELTPLDFDEDKRPDVFEHQLEYHDTEDLKLVDEEIDEGDFPENSIDETSHKLILSGIARI